MLKELTLIYEFLVRFKITKLILQKIVNCWLRLHVKFILNHPNSGYNFCVGKTYHQQKERLGKET